MELRNSIYPVETAVSLGGICWVPPLVLWRFGFWGRGSGRAGGGGLVTCWRCFVATTAVVLTIDSICSGNNHPSKRLASNPIPPSPATNRNPLTLQIRQQALIALEEATAVIMVVDGMAGCNVLDQEIARFLRQQKVPVILAVNKCESQVTREERGEDGRGDRLGVPPRTPRRYEVLREGKWHAVWVSKGILVDVWEVHRLLGVFLWIESAF